MLLKIAYNVKKHKALEGETLKEKNYAVLFLLMCMMLILTACDDNNSVDNPATESVPSVSDIVFASDNAEETINPEEQQIAVFTAKIHIALNANDANSFANLITTDKFNVVTIYGGEGVVDRVAHQNKDELTINDGELIYNDPQVNPPEVETGINAEMLNYGNFEYNYNECKEGFLEYIDWDNADKDYLTAHFHAFYDQMAWLIDEWNMDKWVVYKLTNDTYLYSKSYSFYSEGWGARVFTGQSFVIKRDGDNYGIVAYIDAK